MLSVVIMTLFGTIIYCYMPNRPENYEKKYCLELLVVGIYI